MAPVPDRVKPPFVIFDMTDVKNYKWRLNIWQLWVSVCQRVKVSTYIRVCSTTIRPMLLLLFQCNFTVVVLLSLAQLCSSATAIREHIPSVYYLCYLRVFTTPTDITSQSSERAQPRSIRADRECLPRVIDVTTDTFDPIHGHGSQLKALQRAWLG